MTDGPRMRCDLNLITVWQLPGWSTGPRGEPEEILAAVRDAGYEGVQGSSPRRCEPFGLACSASGRVDDPALAHDQAAAWADKGFDRATLHVGSGIEDDDTAARLVEAVLESSQRTGLPQLIETHRATITQDLWRTVKLVERFPELRFNADLSHWYTGQELTYGDFDARLEFMAPVLDRVGFIHGRISDPGCIQVAVAAPDDERSFVEHFRRMWSTAMSGFKANGRAGDVLVFAPELLPSSIHYARTNDAGEEECDRWEQAQILTAIAKSCWSAA